MKKFSLQFLFTSITRYKTRMDAVKIVFIVALLCCLGFSGYAQVSITKVSDLDVCAQTAVTGTSPSCTGLGSMIIAETTPGDFAIGADGLTLSPPAGWQFCTGSTPTITGIGTDFTVAPAISYVAGNLNITFTIGTTAVLDSIVVSGIQIQPLTTTAVSGFIFAATETGVAGVTPVTTDFGDLAIGGAPTAYAITGGGGFCAGGAGSVIALSGSDIGAVYNLVLNSTTIVSTVSGTGGSLNFGAQSATGTYTAVVNFGTPCAAAMTGSVTVTVNPLPTVYPTTGGGSFCIGTACPIIGLSGSDASAAYNVYCGTTVVATAAGSGGALDFGTFCTPCNYVITATNPTTGCTSTMGTVPVNTIGSITPISGNNVCRGYTYPMTDTTAGGIWTSSNTSIATVGSLTGIATGIAPGTVTLTYTVGSCSATYPITVPAATVHPIVGVHNLCPNDSEIVTDVDGGGTTSWEARFVDIVSISTGRALVYATNSGLGAVIYHDPAGCSLIDSITVNPDPVITTRDKTICQGSSTGYVANISGGEWTSTNILAASVGTATGDVYGVGAGSSTISYTISLTGCWDTTRINVNPLPAPITGPGINGVCVGQTTSDSDATTGGSWISGNSLVAGINATTGTISGVSQGTSIITYILPTGCEVTTVISVNGIPGPITGPDSVCAGSSITLVDDSSGLGPQWSSSNTAVANIGSVSGIVNGVRAGTTIITFQTGAGCVQTYIVTVDSLPAAITGRDTVCAGSASPLTSTFYGIGYNGWSISNRTVAYVDPSGSLDGLSPGTAIVTYTNPSGCYVTVPVMVDSTPPPINGSLAFCVGSTTNLTDSVAGGSWVTNPFSVDTLYVTGDTAHVYGIDTGYATATYSLNGCSTTSSLHVTPVPGRFFGSLSLCAGAIDTLVDSGTTGGIWTSSDPGIASIGSLSGIVTTYSGVSGGVIITYTLGSCSHQEPLNVLAAGPITGPDTVCSRTAYWLQDTIPNASTGGIWTSSNAAVINVIGLSGYTDSATAIGALVGTAIITYTAPDGCMATHFMVVDTAPSLTAFYPAVCVGDSFLVTVNTAFGSWVNTGGSAIDSLLPIGTDSAEIYGISTGTSSIFYYLANGCATGFSLTVNPLPDPIGGTVDSLCEGTANSITYTDGVPGGTWISSSPLVASVNPVSGLLTGVNAGTAIISYSFGGCYVADTVTIDPVGVIHGPGGVCLGFSATYTDTPPGGTWSNDNPAVGTIDPASGVFTSIALGTTNITYVTTSMCPAMLTVTVNPLPGPIYGNVPVCQGSMDTVFDDSTGGVWTGNNPGVGIVSFSNGIVTGVSGGTFTITYTISTTGCYTTAIDTVYPLPSAITGTSYMCLNQTTILRDATLGGTWSSSNTAVTTITSSGVATGVTLGSAVITYTMPTGCYVTQLVTVQPHPSITIRPVHEICIGGADTLFTSSVPLSSFTWAPPYALSLVPLGPTKPIVTPTVTTVYTVTATSVEFGCISDTTITVQVDSLLRFIKIVGKDSICAGTCDTLMASGRNLTYFAWKPAVALSGVRADTVVACPDTTTNYTATAIDAYGCRDSVEFKVTVNPLPNLTIAGNENPVIVCRGTPKQLLAFGAYSYVWTPPYFLSCDTCSNPFATDTSNFIYELYGTSKFGCRDSLSVRVSVLDTNYNRAGDDTIICLGSSTQLNAYSHSVTGNLDVPSYLWIPATGLNNPELEDPIATPDTTTLYKVIITENACFTDTIPVLITVDSFPVISISQNPVGALQVAGTAVQLNTIVTVDTAESYLWTPGISVSCDTCPNPIVTPSVNTTYTVKVTSNHGCISYDTVTINIACNSSEVFIPNTFTPNGDGANDLFYVSAKGITTITRMSVYNRWGQLVFQANNIPPDMPGYGWDGTYKGVVLEPDVFDYVVTVVCELGQTYSYTGTISLVR